MEIFGSCIEIIFTKCTLGLCLLFILKEKKKGFWVGRRNVLYRINNGILIITPYCNREYLKDIFMKSQLHKWQMEFWPLHLGEVAEQWPFFFSLLLRTWTPWGHDFVVQTFCTVFLTVQLITKKCPVNYDNCISTRINKNAAKGIQDVL